MKQTPYQTVLTLAKQKGGTLNVNDPDLTAALVKNGKSTAYRLPTYVWEIRTKASLTVNPVRQGKTVIAYDFPAFKTLSASEVVETVASAPSVQEPVAVGV
jgi:hypothetical protein